MNGHLFDLRSQEPLQRDIRKVKAGRRVIVTHHGSKVAEIRPVEAEPVRLEARLEQFERDGVIQRPADPERRTPLVARRRGALTRFLASRD